MNSSKNFPMGECRTFLTKMLGAELRQGEIELLKIQDGLAVMAEVTRKKIKFAS